MLDHLGPSASNPLPSRLSARSWRVLQGAREESVRFQHEYIGTEHILLGITHEFPDLLSPLSVSREGVWRMVEESVRTGHREIDRSAVLPFTSRAKKLLLLSREQADASGSAEIEPEHLLLACLGSEQSVSREILQRLGVDPDSAPGVILGLLPAPADPSLRDRGGPTPAAEQPAPTVLLADVLWRRLDQPCLEHSRLTQVMVGFYAVHGTVLGVVEGRPFEVQYLVQCNLDWTTRAVHLSINGSPGGRLNLQRDEAGVWRREGERVPELDGVMDVDLAISPSTNTLPIRRLGLEVGSEATVDAAWVRFPSLAVERLPQWYTRTAEHRYRYESRGGSFTTDLEVDDQGVVVRYGDVWERIAGTSPP